MIKTLSGFGIGFFVLLVMTGVFAADVAIIEGVVNDDFQIVTDDNQIYEIGFTDEGEKLAEEITKRVKVKGKIDIDEDNIKTINVVSFEIINEKSGE